MKKINEYFLSVNEFLVAHRGASAVAPENTMAAFELALNAGADLIETDIQFTKDDKVVIFHDKDLSRTSDSEGIIGEMNFTDLEKVDNGSWFNEKFKGQRIMLLEELIEFLQGKAYLNLEIKSRETSVIDYRVDKIIDTVKKYNFQNQTLFSSFDYGLMAKIKKNHPELFVGVIQIPGDTHLPSELCKPIGAVSFVCDINDVNEKIAEDARNNNIVLAVYSIDNEEQLAMARKLGIKAIVTNHPGKIGKLINK